MINLFALLIKEGFFFIVTIPIFDWLFLTVSTLEKIQTGHTIVLKT